MSQDQLTYSRATTASLIGLVTQVLLTLLLAVLGFYAGSKALLAGASYVVPGIWIWAALWVLYKQHRLEHDEALAASQLADSDARSAALFEEAGAQLAQAKRRLENIYKWGLPIISGVSAVYLTAVGGLLLFLNNGALNSEALTAAPIKEGINTSLVALLLVLGWLAGFLVARYVAGMTRVDAWQALRGGASTLIGNVFLGVLPLLVATLLLFFGNNNAFIYLALVIPGVMILLGVEIILATVFGFYRPRKTGEFVRPAFDSRVLGWLTRPESMGKIFSETINYQFGFEVSKSWFMRLLGKALLPLGAVCLAFVVGMTSLVIVGPHQQAVVTQNGAFVRIAEPGLSFKAPWPFGRAEKHDVNRVHTLKFGSRIHVGFGDMKDVPILWTNPHVEEGATEELLITAPPPGVGTAGGKDSVLGEMIGADIEVKFRIADLRAYAGIDNPTAGSTDPETLLQTIGQHEVTSYFATHDTDAILSSARATAGADLQAAIQEELNKYSVGLEIVFVSVSGVHPPQEVADSYHARINALQESQTAEAKALQEADVILATAAGDRERASRLSTMIERFYVLDTELKQLEPNDTKKAEVSEALEKQRVAIELLMIESGGLVGQRLAEARAIRWSTSLSAEARAARLKAELQAFKSAPNYYPVSRYLDALIVAMSDRPKTILGTGVDASKPEVVLDHDIGGVPGLGAP